MNYTFFFHLTSPFSNFHPARFEYKDYTFISNEQFMMYSKARTFNDTVSAQKILDMNNSPLAQQFLKGELSREDITKDTDLSKQWNSLMVGVKKLGRGVKNYNDEVWNNRRINVVLFGARLKFTQNEDLKQILLNTGDSLMCEASRFDPIWSCGLSEYDAKKIPPEQWPGLNLLGKVLDTLKTELRVDLQAIECIKKESGIEVVNFYKVGKSIPEDGVYIGRANKRLNLVQSKFANPFPMKEQTEEERNRVVSEYRKWVWQEVSSGNITKEDILALKDKKLVCYCAPKACHGDVLKALVEYVLNNEHEFYNKIYANQQINKIKI